MKTATVAPSAPAVAGPTRAQQALALLACVLLCFAASGIGALASVSAGPFYAELVRPTWSPPGWLFGPVWTILYLLMAVAAWLVWRAPQSPALKRVALGLFGAQLVANALWSWLFFGWRLGGLAFADVLLLGVLIACTQFAFGRISKPAAWLLLPYLLWVGFASVLNWTLWQLNPNLLG